MNDSINLYAHFYENLFRVILPLAASIVSVLFPLVRLLRNYKLLKKAEKSLTAENREINITVGSSGELTIKVGEQVGEQLSNNQEFEDAVKDISGELSIRKSTTRLLAD
jgi:ArsR family metal-binding transcriptional regulator